MSTVKELRGICQPDKLLSEELVHGRVARIVSIYFTRMFLKSNISANTVTGLHFFIGLVAVVVVSVGEFAFGALLFSLAFILDCSDGEVARYMHKNSTLGLHLDILSHYIVDPLIVYGVGIGAWLHSSNVDLLLLGGFMAICVVLVRLAREGKFIALSKARLGYRHPLPEKSSPKFSGPSSAKNTRTRGFLKSKYRSLLPHIPLNCILFFGFLHVLGFFLGAAPYIWVLEISIWFYGLTFPVLAAGLVLISILDFRNSDNSPHPTQDSLESSEHS